MAQSLSDLQAADSWDPCKISDKQTLTPLCLRRLKVDLQAIYAEPLPLIFVLPDTNDITKIHAIISGPQNTPYEGGFFHFFIRITSDYPIKPPRVRILTTGHEQVRFNPNFYKNGKVCLSTLGTWSGPQWSAAQSLRSLLLSIQSLMNDKPYHNEPGYERERIHGDVSKYNEVIRHETLRVATIQILEEAEKLPQPLQEMIEKSFLELTGFYQELIGNHLHLDGEKFRDPMGTNHGKFCYAKLFKNVNDLHEKLSQKYFGHGPLDKSGKCINFESLTSTKMDCS